MKIEIKEKYIEIKVSDDNKVLAMQKGEEYEYYGKTLYAPLDFDTSKIIEEEQENEEITE